MKLQDTQGDRPNALETFTIYEMKKLQAPSSVDRLVMCGMRNAKDCSMHILPSHQGMGTCSNSNGLEMVGPPMNNISSFKVIRFERSGIATRDIDMIAREVQLTGSLGKVNIH